MKKLLLFPAVYFLLTSVSWCQVFTLPYYEDFETGSPGWLATVGPQSNWELGAPSYGNINSVHSGGNCWAVNLDSAYIGGTHCFLDVPAIDLGNHTGFRVSMWLNSDVETYYDGVVIMYRTDTTIPAWNVLGAYNAPGSVNWYNLQNLISSNLPGWSGTSGGWFNASILIPNIFGNTKIWLRFRFTSDLSVSWDGFAMDDFSIEPAEINYISGAVYRDVNGNAQIDTTDVPVSLVPVTVSSGSQQQVIHTNTSGLYYLIANTAGGCSVIAQPPVYYTVAPQGYNITMPGSGQVSSGNDFLFIPTPGITDVWVNHHSPSMRPGFQTIQSITFGNKGTDTANGQIDFQFHPWLSVISASASFSPVTPTQITIPYTGLLPGEERMFQLVMYCDSGAVTGNVITANAVITPYLTDMDTSDNSDITLISIVNSFDPNNKLVNPEGNVTPTQVSAGLDLEYTLNFQNTGTAPAIHINLFDMIDDKLDLSTFSLISTSHPVTGITVGPNRQLHVSFANINLPDSTADEIHSHGYIRYSIQPYNNLMTGDTIINTAAIHFDNNFPVMTNSVMTVVEDPSGLIESSANPNLILYPNPNNGEFIIKSDVDNHFRQWTIVDVTGRILDFGSLASSKRWNINTSIKTPGVYFIKLSGPGGTDVVRFLTR